MEASLDFERPICARCGERGAGSPYKARFYHMTCKLEAKLDAGELASTVGKPVQPRLRGTGSKQRKRK